jgi:predicted MPP superfamily phosphohydrolase
MRLSLFLFTFLSIYGSVHLYAFFKTKAALCLNWVNGIFLGLFMMLMVISPVMVRILEREGFEPAARSLAYLAYSWMGFLFLFFCLSLTLDVCRAILRVIELLVQKDAFPELHSPRSSFLAFVAISTAIMAYGYYEARHIRTERVRIETSKIPPGLGKLRIVQISDVHLGLIVGQERLDRILRKAREAKPDILISTGDLLDGQTDDISALAQMFKDIRPRYGSFAITGNHEFYVGLDRSLQFMDRAGFSILRDQAATVSGLINIVGLDDPAGNPRSLSGGVSAGTLLSGVYPGKFTLLLKHRPTVDKETLGLFDLQLSGHTHRGQIFPFNFVTRIHYPLGTGLVPLEKDAYLYVSRGSGTWGPPVRFLAPPEVTVIDLVPKK